MRKALALTLSLAATSLSGVALAEQLSGAEVEALLEGNTLRVEDWGGEGTTTYGGGNISTNVTKSDGTMVEDTGTMRYTDEGYCSTWQNLRTEEKCFTLNKVSDSEYDVINPDGSFDSKIFTN